MEILNIGPLELIIILVIMFVLLGPKQMIITAYQIGKFIRGVVRSPMWKEIIGYSEEIRELPKKLMEETALEETLADVKKSTQEATDEIKNSLKEVSDAARVPEAEHIRLDSGAAQAAGNSAAAAAAAVEGSTPNLTPQSSAELAEETAASPDPVAQFVPVERMEALEEPVEMSTDAPSADLPFEPALRPRRLRLVSEASAQMIDAPAAPSPVLESFAPRAARRAAAPLAVIAATGVVDPHLEHNGANGHNGGNTLALTHSTGAAEPEGTSAPADEAEARDAAE